MGVRENTPFLTSHFWQKFIEYPKRADSKKQRTFYPILEDNFTNKFYKVVFMKTKILLLMAKQTLTQALASSEVAKNIAMHWNINNNCGRRPQGLRYPLPDNSTGNYLDNIECDIMENTRYISGYQCIAP